MDEEWEIYLQAWQAFHEAADLVDGHLNAWEMTPDTTSLAIAAGTHAMDLVLQAANKPKPAWNDAKWQKAKRMAWVKLGY